MKTEIVNFWSIPQDQVIKEIKSGTSGLTQSEAEERLTQYGANTLSKGKKTSPAGLFLKQLTSPITLILLFATVISIVLHDFTDSVIILFIVLASALLGFLQEYNAGNAVSKLLDVVSVKADVWRDGQLQPVSIESIVPGDLVELHAGDVLPADGIVLSGNSLSVDESTLTGETFPVEKKEGVLPEDTALADRTNSLWMGTHVVSGTGQLLVVQTGAGTEFGRISTHLSQAEPETDFERGVRQFGTLLMKITGLMLVMIFVVNIVLKKPVFDSFLFSMSLAVGLTPQLLPAIISVNLSQGAKRMAEKKVIVKKLESIENFGSMDVLCTDKTGTITVGNVGLQGTLGVDGESSERVALLAKINAHLQSGYENSIDQAIEAGVDVELDGYIKLREIPYNFVDKRLGILFQSPDSSPFSGNTVLVSKGAFDNVMRVCTHAETKSGSIVPIGEQKDAIAALYQSLSASGLRTLGIAYKTVSEDPNHARDEDMVFAGLITFKDPLKAGIDNTVKELDALHVQLKVITGDNRYVAANIAEELGLNTQIVLTGTELAKYSESALVRKVSEVSVFAEIEPNQKERIIRALMKAGLVVGYMGDGINDAAAIHAADVGISVNTAADVAKEAANIVLLEQDLEVLIEGIKAGRRTFANTMKYVFMATSANFGNMFSMAGASIFLPFLPLRPTQILLTNLLTDFPEMQIAKDTVDEEQLAKPRRWNIAFIKKFMTVFGLLSSVFDYMTFGVLMLVFGANEALFQTGWFTESILSATMIVFVMRTQRRFTESRPSKGILIATALVILATLALPYTPLGTLLHFAPLPGMMYVAIFAIVILYMLSGELLKRWFYQHNQP